MVQLTAYGRLTTFVHRLEEEWRRERDPARRGKLLVRLALARIALTEPEPSRAVILWRRLARKHLERWDHDLDNPGIDLQSNYTGTDELLSDVYELAIQRVVLDREQRSGLVHDVAGGIAATLESHDDRPVIGDDMPEYLDIPR